MTPNGRRAWRRFAKQQRRKVNRKNRNTGTPWINDADGAFYRHEQKHFAQRPALPPQSFTARSLVGMTMGARKRAWLSNALYPVVFPSGIITDETEMKAGYSWPEIRSDWPLLGHKLRPCPGCMDCDPHGFPSICDGSGVLPAGKQK